MKKILIQGLILITVFCAALFVLRQIDWMKLFKVENYTQKTEKKLGEQLWKIYKDGAKDSSDTLLINAVDTIISKLCAENNINRSGIKAHLLIKDEVNAFALPGGHLIIYTGLINDCDNQEQLIGVLGHEIAHIQLNHVMEKLIKEVGLSAIISITAGSGGDMLRQVAKMLSSTAFDRRLEREADLKSVDYMINAGINPKPFANFLSKMAEKKPDKTKYFSWISTHPDSQDRANYILDYIKVRTIKNEQVISSSIWDKIKMNEKDSNLYINPLLLIF